MSDAPTLFVSAFVLGIAFCAPPGPVTAEALRRGIRGGFSPVFLLEIGSLVGDAFWAIVALSGSAVLIQIPGARLALGLAGSMLLLWLAAGAIDSARRDPEPHEAIAPSQGAFAAGAFLSLTNPLAVAYWLSVGGAMTAIGVDAPGLGSYAVFFSGFMIAAVLWCFFFSALVAYGRRLLSPFFFRAIDLVCGAALGYFGLKLLLATLRFAGVSI